MNFEEEMSRFEAEINRNNSLAAAAFIGVNTFHSVQQRLHHAAAAAVLDPNFIPSQIHARAGLPPPLMPHGSAAAFMMMPPQLRPKVVMSAGPTTISAPPKTLTGSAAVAAARANKSAAVAKEEEEEEEDVFSKLAKYEADHKKEVKKKKKSKTSFTPSTLAATTSSSDKTRAVPAAAAAAAAAPPPQPPPPASKPFAPAAAGASNTPVSAKIGDDALKKAKKQKRIIRTGGGQIWEDPSLKEWDTNDFRLFCGDLGNDVTDEVLARTFGRYPSFVKAKVVRDKKSNKTKGYGFISFSDPMDFTKAMREMNGKYVGSRPIKLRKSNWKDRNVDVVRQKQKIKQQMGYKW